MEKLFENKAPSPSISSQNVYEEQVRSVLPRVLSLFDRDQTSTTYGMGDRFHWGWKLIDFGNGTFQGAAHGLSRFYKAELLGDYLNKDEFLELIDSIFSGTNKLIRKNGSLEEAFPYESSFCVTALVAFDLLTAIDLLRGDLGEDKQNVYLKIVGRLISFLKKNDEYHAFISNHLATASAALFKWNKLTHDKVAEAKAQVLLARILDEQSSEGWFKEYEGADPGYQTLCLYYLADIYKERLELDLKESLQNALKFLSYFAHPDGSFGGLYGSRNTQFICPAGIKFLSKDFEDARALDDFAVRSFSKHKTISLNAFDEPNLIPMFNAYAWAASMNDERAEQVTQVPSLRDEVFQKHFEAAGIYIDKGSSHYSVISLRKGGVCSHFTPAETRINPGLILEDTKNHLYSTQAFEESNEVSVEDRKIKIQSKFIKMRKAVPTPFQFIVLRMLNISLMKVPLFNRLIKRLLVSLLITKKEELGIKNIRTIYLGLNLKIVDEQSPRDHGYKKLRTSSPFSAQHMASQGYWQK